MKIIDVHQHLMTRADPTGKMLVRYLDTNGIEKALVMGCDEAVVNHVGNNEMVRAAVERFPDRLIGGCYVDPRAVESACHTIRVYHDHGFKCVKMFPYHGYFPDEPALYPVYELITELDTVVLFHCGGGSVKHAKQIAKESGGPVKRAAFASYKYSLPCYFDALGHGFPDMKIILAHLGGCLQLDEVFYLADNHDNLYLDTSSTSASAALGVVKRNGNDYAKPLDFSKLLWGRDGYCLKEAEKPSTRVQGEHALIMELVEDPAIREKIFYGNAKKLLGV